MTKYEQALDDAAKDFNYKDYNEVYTHSLKAVLGEVFLKFIQRRAADLHAQRFAEWAARKTWANYKSKDDKKVLWLMYVDNISQTFTSAQLMERYNQQED